MSEGKPAKPTREDRLAAKLRENLRRRKSQTREMTDKSGENGVPKDAGQS